MKGLAAPVHLKYRQLNLQRPQSSRLPNMLIWQASGWRLTKMQRSTEKLLKEHRALRNHYEVFQKSLEVHINMYKLQSLEGENKALKHEVSSLKQTVRNADEKITDLNADQNGVTNHVSAAISQIDDLEQNNRKHSLQILGISKTPEEDIPKKIIKFWKVLNVHGYTPTQRRSKTNHCSL